MRTRPAHPRSRGENSAKVWQDTVKAGSSPLTRGKPSSLTLRPRTARLIPAHAGKTACLAEGEVGGKAHPRSRGENRSDGTARARGSGSSPLTRGKLSLSRLRLCERRLIPAHAGKTRTRTHPASSSQAHPRSRGENNGSIRALSAYEGSSPLTRGKRLLAVLGCARERLIPAHAGKTRWSHRAGCSPRAHPRSRGENRRCVSSPPICPGSSPLTRGKPGSNLIDVAAGRLIPAHAGKTKRSDHTDPGPAAHPRSRGENRANVKARLNVAGSSPLTRGKRRSRSATPGGTGLIPAHAGKTG